MTELAHGGSVKVGTNSVGLEFERKGDVLVVEWKARRWD